MQRMLVLASVVGMGLLFGLGTGRADAQVTPGLRLQGTLTDTAGTPLNGVNERRGT